MRGVSWMGVSIFHGSHHLLNESQELRTALRPVRIRPLPLRHPLPEHPLSGTSGASTIKVPSVVLSVTRVLFAPKTCQHRNSEQNSSFKEFILPCCLSETSPQTMVSLIYPLCNISNSVSILVKMELHNLWSSVQNEK